MTSTVIYLSVKADSFKSYISKAKQLTEM